MFTPILKAQKNGYIVNIGSIAGIVCLPQMASYNASKAAVVALSETLKVELSDANVGVSVVFPSVFKSNIANVIEGDVPMVNNFKTQLLRA